jgi:hypothetical protein
MLGSEGVYGLTNLPLLPVNLDIVRFQVQATSSVPCLPECDSDDSFGITVTVQTVALQAIDLKWIWYGVPVYVDMLFWKPCDYHCRVNMTVIVRSMAEVAFIFC